MRGYEDKTNGDRFFTSGMSGSMAVNTTTTSREDRVFVTSRQLALWYLFCAVLFWLYASPLLFHDGFLQLNSDEANYVWKAQHISGDVGFVATEQAWRRHPPLIPAIVGLLAKVMSLQVAVLVATKTFAIIGIVLVYIMGVQVGGPVAGLIASVLLAADPTYRGLSNILLLDIPLMIFFVVCALLLLRGGRCRVWAVVTGILALLVKDYGVLVLAYALACVAWDFLIARGWRPAAVVGIVLVSSAAVLTPLGLYLRHIPCCDSLAWLSWLAQVAQPKIWHILDNSVGWLVPAAQKRYLAIFLLLIVPLVLKMLSFYTARINVILLAWIATILGPYFLSYAVDERVVLLSAPARYVIIGACVAHGLALVKTAAMARSLFVVLSLSCVSLLLLAQSNPGTIYYIKCRHRANFSTGDWIRQNIPNSGRVVFTRSPHQVRFYASSEFEKDGGIFYGKDEWTGIPRTVSDFRRVLDRTDKTAYLIVDFEEMPDPRWLSPPNRDAAEAIQRLGFELAHVVWIPAVPHCERPNSSYHSELPGFLKHLKLPLYRNAGSTREQVGAVLFKRNVMPPPAAPREPPHRLSIDQTHKPIPAAHRTVAG